MKNPRLIIIAVAAFIILVLVVGLSGSMFVTIEPGHKGVVFRRFAGGLDKETIFDQGFHIIAPWNTMKIYDVRIKEKTEKMDVLAKNGLSIEIDMSFRYKPIDDQIGYIHDEIGEEYEQKIVIPEIRSSTRKVIGKYLPEELYSTKREVIQTEIFSNTAKNLRPKHVTLDAILIRSVSLPPTIKTAIESKLKQEQESAEYEFRIEKESKEAERKRIEAKGIKDFQDIISEGISEKYLKWKGIEATEELSKSSNSKIVIIGGGDGGLPVILNQ